MLSCSKLLGLGRVSPAAPAVPPRPAPQKIAVSAFRVSPVLDLGKVRRARRVVFLTGLLEALAALNLDASLVHELLRLLGAQPAAERVRHRLLQLLASCLAQCGRLAPHLLSNRQTAGRLSTKTDKFS